MLKRSDRNPILVADPKLEWCSIKVYNCAVYKEGLKYLMLFRGVGNDWISRIGFAESLDGITFTILGSPSLVPSQPWEKGGCEDPRITKIDGTYWISYTAFDGTTARAALTSSTDLKSWNSRRLLFPQWQHNPHEKFPMDWSKSAAIFPAKIGDQYLMLFGDSHIWMAASTNLTDWLPNVEPFISARVGYFDAGYVENGPPPILTDRGWLVLYHGVDNLEPTRTYRLGAMLLDINDPQKIIWRCKEPILEPIDKHEVVGFIDVIEGGFETLKGLTMKDLHQLSKEEKLPKAIFCCGALLEGDTVRLYYGAGDTVICTATIELESILKS